ncbi:ATP-dependent peptidase, putative [Ricinus communis]|uniref:ATP-dependent peptidase, putative n=1 Tax=Ricinus communis TaxID=3988 RepID=B9S715_RICCO|nr:ATP-dependent peptidase, putative [Ricinus communis]
MFVYIGRKGIANDSRIFLDALTRNGNGFPSTVICPNIVKRVRLEKLLRTTYGTIITIVKIEIKNDTRRVSRGKKVNFNGSGTHQLSLSWSTIRRRSCFSPNALELPLLPFNTSEVLVPSESKTLHLYEARYLALLEESLLRKQKLFVHFVLDPILISSSGTEASFAARYGCLVIIENVERLDVGALVSIRGIGRVKIAKFLQSDPYLIGEVIPVQDWVLESASKLTSKVAAVKEALCNLNSLEIKLKAPKEALLQTRIANSLSWAEKEPSLECDKAFIPSLAERVSFTALQPISGKCLICFICYLSEIYWAIP